MRSDVRKTRGQNVVEYLVLVTAIAVVCISLFVKGGKFTSSVNAMMAAPMNMIVISNQTLGLQPPP